MNGNKDFTQSDLGSSSERKLESFAPVSLASLVLVDAVVYVIWHFRRHDLANGRLMPDLHEANGLPVR